MRRHGKCVLHVQTFYITTNVTPTAMHEWFNVRHGMDHKAEKSENIKQKRIEVMTIMAYQLYCHRYRHTNSIDMAETVWIATNRIVTNTIHTRMMSKIIRKFQQ
eukprot:156238_1